MEQLDGSTNGITVALTSPLMSSSGYASRLWVLWLTCLWVKLSIICIFLIDFSIALSCYYVHSFQDTVSCIKDPSPLIKIELN